MPRNMEMSNFDERSISMIDFKKGCKVPFPEKIFEQYEKVEQGYMANINVGKIIDAVKEFVARQNENVFFFLEVPASLDDEKEIEPGVLDGTHKDVYYMDDMDEEEVNVLLDAIGELLVNDGLLSFGFGSPKSKDEIIVGKYNVVKIYSYENHSYDDLFKKLEIPQTTNLITAWDTFTIDSPGVSDIFELNGKDVYSMIEDFKEIGLYFAEQRED